MGERGGFEQTHSAQHCAVARTREHLPAPEEGHAERGLEEVRSQRRHPDKTRMRSGRRTVRAAALRLDGACLSVRGDAGEDLDALKNGRKDTHVAPVLPECARGTNRIVKLREVLPPRAQGERHAYPSKGKTTSELGRII